MITKNLFFKCIGLCLAFLPVAGIVGQEEALQQPVGDAELYLEDLLRQGQQSRYFGYRDYQTVLNYNGSAGIYKPYARQAIGKLLNAGADNSVDSYDQGLKNESRRLSYRVILDCRKYLAICQDYAEQALGGLLTMAADEQLESAHRYLCYQDVLIYSENDQEEYVNRALEGLLALADSRKAAPSDSWASYAYVRFYTKREAIKGYDKRALGGILTLAEDERVAPYYRQQIYKAFFSHRDDVNQGYVNRALTGLEALSKKVWPQ